MTHHVYQMIQYANNLIHSFKNIDKNVRNLRRITGKLRKYTDKITHIYAANLPKVAYICIWCQINAKTRLFCSMVGYTKYLMKVLKHRVEGLIRQ